MTTSMRTSAEIEAIEQLLELTGEDALKIPAIEQKPVIVREHPWGGYYAHRVGDTRVVGTGTTPQTATDDLKSMIKEHS